MHLGRIHIVEWDAFASDGVLPLIAITAIGTLGDFGVQVLLAQSVSVAWYGDYSIAYATMMLGGIAAILGADRTCMRFLPGYIGAHDQSRISGFVLLYAGLAFGVSFVVVAAVAVAHYALDTEGISFFDTTRGHPVLLAVWLIPAYALYRLAPGVLSAAHHPVRATLISRFSVPAIVALAIVALLQTGYEITPKAILGAFAFSFLVVALLIFAVLPEGVPVWCRDKTFLPKAWLAISLPIMAGQFVFRLNAYSSTILLEVIGRNETEVGLFSATQSAGTLVLIPYVALLAAVLPRFGEIAQGDEHLAARQALYGRTTRLLGVLSLLVAVPIILLREQVLGMFGADYQTADMVLAIVTFTVFLTGAVGIAAPLLQFCGHEKLVLSIIVGSTLIDVLLCLYLVPRFEAMGAATSFMIRGLLADLIAVYVLWRYEGLVPFVTHTRRSLGAKGG